MEITRGQEILMSRETVEVQHNGQSVWIDGVDEYNRTARVHRIDNPDQRQTVPVDQLNEIG